MATGGEVYQAILLAAGSGQRFGGGKLLASFEGGVLLESAMAAAFAAPVSHVTLVTGADAERVGEVARTWARQHGETPRLRIVHARDHLDGMGASLRTGALSLDPMPDGVFVLLGDMPRIPKIIFRPLIEALETGALAAAPVCAGKRGHPALIGKALIPRLATLSGDAGARHILKDLGQDLALIDCADEGVLLDIDTRADLDRA